MNALFVTSSGTGTGKTYVAAGLARALTAKGLRVRALKPVASGYPGDDADATDTHVLLRASGTEPDAGTIAACSPWRFEAPLSPDMAAAREGRAIDFEALVAFCRDAEAGPEDWLLVEGIGGAMVPLDETRTVLDWMAALGWPALVVVGSYLGTLSHALTAVAAMEGAGVAVAGVSVDESEDGPVPVGETVATLGRFLGAVPVAAVARHAPPDAVLAALADMIGA